MHENLKTKCENLMMFMNTNLYIHSLEDNELIVFSKLNIPIFLRRYIDDEINRLMKKKEETSQAYLSSNQVNLYIDPFKFSYLIWPMIDMNGIQRMLTLGPIITEHLSRESIHYMGYTMKLGSDALFILESFIGTVPYYDKFQVVRIASMFLDYLAIEPHLPQIIREDHSVSLDKNSDSIEAKFEHYDFVAHNYEEERRMLKAIEQGDTTYINSIINALDDTIHIPPRYPSDPLRERKNLALTMNSIAMRAALKGGLNQSISHNLSHNYAIKIESLKTQTDINMLINDLLVTYVESVRKYALKNMSNTIKDAVNYIRRHLTERITLKDIAYSLHISPEHLSRKFKEEMGITINHYIHKIKIEESCTLLTSSQYSVSHIAYLFGYSSPAHYTKSFRSVLGVSPKQWLSS